MNPIRSLIFTFALTFVITSVKSQPFPETMWSDIADIGWYDSSENEFTLTTAEELAGVELLVRDGNDFSSQTIFLGADIDLNDHTWTPIGTQVNFAFSGSVDGNHHTISNLWVNRGNLNLAGLFGVCDGASLINIRVDTAGVYGYADVGILVGRLHDSTVENCHTTVGHVISGGCNAGGLVGNAQFGSAISRCSADAYVDGFCQAGGLVGSLFEKSSVSLSYATGYVSGGSWVGGLVGVSNAGAEPDRINTIINSYARSDINTINRGGGLLGGGAQFDVQNCYSTGFVPNHALNGSFIGNVEDGTGQNNYYDMLTAGSNDSIGFFDGAPTDLEVTPTPTYDMRYGNVVDWLNAGNPDGPWIRVPELNDRYPILSGGPMATINPRALDQAIRLYPTLFRDSFTLESDVTMNRFEMFDLSGGMVESGELNTELGHITPRHLKTGMYIVRIYTQRGVLSKKVIKE